MSIQSLEILAKQCLEDAKIHETDGNRHTAAYAGAISRAIVSNLPDPSEADPGIHCTDCGDLIYGNRHTFCDSCAGLVDDCAECEKPKQWERLNNEITQLRARINSVTNDFCTCGGAGPNEGCIACDIYHVIRMGESA